MRLPHKLPTSQQDKETLGKFYDAFQHSPWFERAELVDTTTPKTLEVYVASTPPKDVLFKFTQTYALTFKVIMVRPTRTEMTKFSEPVARQHCGPIFFTRSFVKASKENIITNGSFGLVDTGTKKLLVTCHHVWEGFDKEHFKDPNVKMCVCLDSKNPVYLDEKHLIDRDKQADLATFDMAELLSACGSLKFFNIHSKPPPKVNRDDTIFLIGFPGHGRNAAGDFISFNRNPFGMIVSSVDDNRFHANVESIPWEADKYGGISGCPAFLISAGRANELQLAGFAMGVWMKQLMFTHARQLLPNGRIKR